MAKIYSYQKASDDYTTYSLAGEGITELCTLDGITYCSVPDGVVLPEQPMEIAASVQTVILDDTLRERIKAASPHAQLIGQRMIDTIRAAYSVDDEMYFARIGVGAATGMYMPTSGELEEMAVFGNFVEGVRDWGRNERALLGL